MPNYRAGRTNISNESNKVDTQPSYNKLNGIPTKGKTNE